MRLMNLLSIFWSLCVLMIGQFPETCVNILLMIARDVGSWILPMTCNPSLCFPQNLCQSTRSSMEQTTVILMTTASLGDSALLMAVQNPLPRQSKRNEFCQETVFWKLTFHQKSGALEVFCCAVVEWEVVLTRATVPSSSGRKPPVSPSLPCSIKESYHSFELGQECTPPQELIAAIILITLQSVH